jgi:hypothetical protein
LYLFNQPPFFSSGSCVDATTPAGIAAGRILPGKYFYN